MKHTIKGFFLMMILVMLTATPFCALAGDLDVGGLTVQELSDWAMRLMSRLHADNPQGPKEQPELTEDGYALVYGDVTLYLNTPTLNEESELNAIVVTGYEVECPRGVGISDTQQQLLTAYANENPTLLGSHDFAVLYLSDSLPEEVLWGRVQRDGQQIRAVQYAVHELVPDMQDQYTDSGLIYSLEDGYVTAVRAYGLSDIITKEQVEKNIEEVAAQQQDESYFAYVQSSEGTDIDAFDRDDLFFSGMDFLSLTPETAVATLGAYETETWLEDDGGDWLRILQWPAAEITFAYDKDKVFQRVDTFALSQRGLEGPRAVMVGDSLSSVIMRFRHSEGEFDGSTTEVLYGDGEAPPFGLAEYNGATATLHYAQPVSGAEGIENVTLYMIFMDTELTELFVYSW